MNAGTNSLKLIFYQLKVIQRSKFGGMSHHIQSQLFPENFLYVVAFEQTHTLKKELEVYHQPTRGFRIFSKVGCWNPKIEKKTFFSTLNDRKWSQNENLCFL